MDCYSFNTHRPEFGAGSLLDEMSQTRDLHRRSWAKLITWRMLMFITNTVIGWAVTGRWDFGITIGLISLVVNSLAYIAHERIWNLFDWGKR